MLENAENMKKPSKRAEKSSYVYYGKREECKQELCVREGEEKKRTKKATKPKRSFGLIQNGLGIKFYM